MTLIGSVRVNDKPYLASAPLTLPKVEALFGTTPRTASTKAGVAEIDAAYGGSKLVRLFWSGTAGQSPVTDRPVVGSFKTMSEATAPWAKTMWRWAYQHEIDSKIKKGQCTLAQWQADMATLVALDIDGLSVILTADCFANTGKKPTDYLMRGVTHLGVDFDGISQSSGYHDYSRELVAVESFAKAYGLTWGVAEFGANRAANDPSGVVRAAWLTDWVGRFVSAGAEYVCLWEFASQAGSEFTTDAEVAAVRALLNK